MTDDGIPRVIEIELGAPAATVLRLDDDQAGARLVVLADPNVPADQLARVVEGARVLVEPTPPSAESTVRIPVQRRPVGESLTLRGAMAVVAAIAGVAASLSPLLAGETQRLVDADGPSATMADSGPAPVPAF